MKATIQNSVRLILPVGQLSFKIAHHGHLLVHFIHESLMEFVLMFLFSMIFGYIAMEVVALIGKKVNHRAIILIEAFLLFCNALLLAQCEEEDVAFCFCIFIIHFALFELMVKILFSSYRCLLLAIIILLLT